jgi:phospholipid/cholesterol/gamma-HCH transport system substrate-binding protein
MQTLRNNLQRSRSLRQSALGLFVLLALGLFGGLILWLRDFSFGVRSYTAIIEFSNAGGMKVGSPVSYRGIKVGQVIGIQPKPTGVDLTVEIAPADLLIPRNTWIEATQAGLIGETSIDMTPQQNLPAGVAIAKPLDRNCNPAIIICNGSRLQGQAKLDVEALIRSLLKISDLLTAPEFTATVASVLDKASDALVSIDGLSREVRALSKDVRQRIGVGTLDTTLKEIGLTAKEFRLTARQINELVAANRSKLAATLDSLKQTSDRMRVTVDSLKPVIDQIGQSKLLQNLNTLSANAAEASSNIRDFSKGLNDPSNIVILQQTLDSARATFQNVHKITSELDELTGDPAFRDNIRQLIDGLSHLVSSTEQLQQQAHLAQILTQRATGVTQPNRTPIAVNQIPPPAPSPQKLVNPAVPVP